MGDRVRVVGWSVVSVLKSQRDLTLENVALRHERTVLHRQSGRFRHQDRDRPLWIWLIRGIWNSNPTWGKPRIQADLRRIGIQVSDSTAGRYRPHPLSPPSDFRFGFRSPQQPDGSIEP